MKPNELLQSYLQFNCIYLQSNCIYRLIVPARPYPVTSFSIVCLLNLILNSTTLSYFNVPTVNESFTLGGGSVTYEHV